MPPFGTKICTDICLGTLPVSRHYLFSESEVRGIKNCELQGTDNVQGQKSMHSFEAKYRLSAKKVETSFILKCNSKKLLIK